MTQYSNPIQHNMEIKLCNSIRYNECINLFIMFKCVCRMPKFVANKKKIATSVFLKILNIQLKMKLIFRKTKYYNFPMYR